MTSWGSEYKTNRAIGEVRPTYCTFTCVTVDNKIKINGVEHSGSVSHRCMRSQGHLELCECKCGHKWKGYQA